LLDCQNDVSQSITKINAKSKLLVLREPALTLLPKLYKAWNISHLVFEKDTDAYARERDAQVIQSAQEAGVQVMVKSGRTLWDPDDLVRANGGKPTMTITQLQRAGEKIGPIPRPLDAPLRLPDPGPTDLSIAPTTPDPRPDRNAPSRRDACVTFSSGIAGPRGDFSPPTLAELGMPEATTPHRGGETVVLRRLRDVLADDAFAATFEKPKTSPAAFAPPSTFLTSPYLHFGALSCRAFYHRVADIVARREREGKAASSPPESLTGQLLFRDMYFAAQAALGWTFGQTLYNGHCRFVPWHLPSQVDGDTKRCTGEYEVDDDQAAVWLRRWTEGMTGFPWIDAIMRYLFPAIPFCRR
jgi:cryptochrome